MVVRMLGIMTCQILGWVVLLGDNLSMTSWARGLLNLTISIHREEQTITMLFTGSFILALMCSDFGFVHETTIFYWWWILWDFPPQIFVCLFTLGKRNW